MGSTVRSKLENSNWGWHDGRVDGVGDQWAPVGNQRVGKICRRASVGNQGLGKGG